MQQVASTRPQVERPSRQWVDLFYDLAIAAGIIDLAGAYSRDASPSGAIWLGLAYAVLWCTWLLTSASTGSFEHSPRPHSVPSLVVLVAQMGVILFLAVASGDSTPDADGLFDLLLGLALVACLVLAVPAWRAGRLSGRVPLLVAVTVVVLAASYLVPDALGLVMWAGVFVVVAAAVWTLASGAELDSHRVLHRLGELTVIVIGETLVKLVLTASEHTVGSIEVAAMVPILATLAAIWWTYFGGLSHLKVIDGARRRAWMVLHLPLHLALLGISVGLAKLLVGDPSLDKPFGTIALVSGPIVASFAVLAALAIASRRGRAAWIIGGGAVVLAIAAVVCGAWLDPQPTAYVIAAMAVVTAGLATTRSQRQPDVADA
jgi:low temperature requirement protein LtrA